MPILNHPFNVFHQSSNINASANCSILLLFESLKVCDGLVAQWWLDIYGSLYLVVVLKLGA